MIVFERGPFPQQGIFFPMESILLLLENEKKESIFVKSLLANDRAIISFRLQIGSINGSSGKKRTDTNML